MNKTQFRFFLLTKIPLAYLAGLRLVEQDRDSVSISLRHTWFNQNPFRSIYFAALAMAAEISTGLLLMAVVKESGLSTSFLVTDHAGSFLKKATGRIVFRCQDGVAAREAFGRAQQNDTSQKVMLHVVGENEEGIVVAEFDFTWSIKIRSSRY